MALFLNDHLKSEPSLMEAVKVVIKYEIQSLLTKLADTGEEYLVITASTHDNSCGHIGSVKGEGFIKNSSLRLIKEEFLQFCTGGQANAKDERTNSDNQNIISKNEISQTSGARRRKSTPRCKSQPPQWQTQQQLQEIQDYAMISEHVSQSGNGFTDPDEAQPSHSSNSFTDQEQGQFASHSTNHFPEAQEAHPSEDNIRDDLQHEPDHVVDLIDKHVGGYSYTLDCSSDSYGSNIMSSSSDVSKYPSKEESPVHNDAVEELLPYAWKEEKIPMNFIDNLVSSNPALDYMTDVPVRYSKSPSVNSQVLASQSSRVLKKEINNKKIFKPIPELEDVESKPVRNRRKPRKALAKPKKSIDANIPIYHAAHEQPFEDQSTDISSIPESKLNPNGLSDRLTQITDMKSAFQEIGNMAKCLICNKVLANKNNRTFHWRSHVGDKRYTCDICNKAFTHPSNMRSHRKIHTDEKPFPCELCDRRFRRRDYLLQHLERFHYNMRSPESAHIDESKTEGASVSQ